MTEDLENKIKRARELIFTSRHIAIATVNEDGSPHNSVVRFVYDSKLQNIYWGSHPESLHSKNVAREGKIFAVLFDRTENGGLYLRSENAHELSGQELENALKIYNQFRIKEGSEPLELNYYLDSNSQRMYGANVVNFWVNHAERGTNGNVIKDGRIEITAKDLLG